MIKKSYPFIILFVLAACMSGEKVNDPIMAKAYDKVLYASDISEAIPNGINQQDSIRLAKSHIEKWVRNQLLLHLAEQNLSAEEKNVEQQIEDYRSSLLIFKYEQNYIAQKLDTVIDQQAIQAYYDNYSSNFVLNHNLIKGIFIRVPLAASNRGKVSQWLRSDDQEHLKDLEEYCYSQGADFDFFEETWRSFSEITARLPVRNGGYDPILKSQKFYETRDTSSYYYLKITDYRLEGMVAPMNMVYDDLHSILLNKRKLEIIQKLETNVYNDALNREQFTITE